MQRSWGRVGLWAFEDLKEGPGGKDEGRAEGDTAGEVGWGPLLSGWV